MNPPDTSLRSLLQNARTIAVVGLSNKPERASHDVARYLQAQGYRIVPVNPVLSANGAQVLGEHCYAQLSDIPFAIDIVDVFRRTEDVPPVASQAIAIGAKCLWQQLGIDNPEAHAQAQAAGLQSVTDRCLKIEHRRLLA
jgi:uncharacterized protein